jgi:hypothetical protein
MARGEPPRGRDRRRAGAGAAVPSRARSRSWCAPHPKVLPSVARCPPSAPCSGCPRPQALQRRAHHRHLRLGRSRLHAARCQACAPADGVRPRPRGLDLARGPPALQLCGAAGRGDPAAPRSGAMPVHDRRERPAAAVRRDPQRVGCGHLHRVPAATEDRGRASEARYEPVTSAPSVVPAGAARASSAAAAPRRLILRRPSADHFVAGASSSRPGQLHPR